MFELLQYILEPFSNQASKVIKSFGNYPSKLEPYIAQLSRPGPLMLKELVSRYLQKIIWLDH